MKKYFLSLVAIAAAMLFATSCQESLVEPQIEGPTTFTVQLPDQMGTKAIGDASSVTELLVDVYAQHGTAPIYQTKGTPNGNNGFDVQLNLIQDQAYDILFWAQTLNGYVEVRENDGKYTFESLRRVPMNANFLNNDNGAAFFHAEKGFVPNGTSKDIVLVRPFAQLNLGTTDASLITNAGNFQLVSSSIKVTGMANQFNVFEGLGFDETVAKYDYGTNGVPQEGLSVSGVQDPFNYVSMNYLAVLGNEKALVDVKASIVVKNIATDETQTIKHTFTNVPVQENYRTNIVGNLISSTTDFVVTIEEGFVDENNNPNPDNDYFVVDNVGAAESEYRQGKTHVAINYIVNGGEINIPNTAKETLYLQLPDVDAEFTVNVPQKVKKLNIAVPNTDESNVGLNLIVNAPYSTVDFTGQAAMITSTTAPNTLNLNGAEVGTIIVKQGNVVIENESQVEVLNNQSGGQVTVYVDSTSDVNVPQDGDFVKIEEPEIINTYEALQNALTYSSEVVLTNDITLSEILVIQRRDFIFDGNGKTLTSTAGRAINVSGADGVTIKNLNIECSGERAINIIQNATNVTIDNVTAKAANYTVNVAASAPGAVVNIENSTLNGLCTVNVSAESANVTVENSTINCNDNNTTLGEAYSALSLNREAVGGKIIATNTVVNVKEGSDSHKGRNGAENGEVTINGSTDEVVVMVAAIIYPNNTNYHAFVSLDGAIDFAQESEGIVTLIRNITVADPVIIEEGQIVVLDLNGKTLSNPNGYAIENYSELTITGEGYMSGLGGIRSHAGKVTIEDGTFTASSKWSEGTYQHILKAVNTVVTIKGGVFTPTVSEGSNAMINVSENSTVTINGGEFRNVVEGEVIPQFAPYMFTYEKNGKLIINGGSFYGGWRFNGETATTDIYGGDFTVSYDGQSFHANSTHVLTIYGGTFSLDNGGKLDPSKHVAEGYKAVQNAETGKWEIVKKDYVAQAEGTKYESLQEAFNVGGEITLLSDVMLTEMAVLESGKTATLDLNGYNITVPEAEKHIYAINNTGNLTLKDSKGTGSVKARGIYNGKDGVASAKMTVMGGNYFGIDTDGGAAIMNYAELYINGGEFYGAACAVNNKAANAQTTIDNGKFGGAYQDNLSTNYVIQNNEGTLIVNNAEVVSGFGAIGAYGGTTTIKDGSFLPIGWAGYTCHVVYVAAAADVTINGGTYKMNYPENAVPDSGSAVASYFKGTLSITGGTFYAHFDNVSPVELSEGSSITGGTYYNHAGAVSQHSYIKNFVAEGYELNANGEVVKK